VHRREAGP